MIYTSYFGNLKRLQGLQPNMVFVSIAGKTPDWFVSQNLGFRYPKLMPKYEWWAAWHEKFKDNLESSESKSWYAKMYADTVLSKLNPNVVQQELYDLSSRLNVCLLCYETPEKFCHRHLVSDWFRKNGIMSGEYVKNNEIGKICSVNDL